MGHTLTAKRDRKRAARAALIAELSMTAERWSSELAGKEKGVTPPEEWPDSDPFVRLALLHGLSFADVSKLCADLGAELEERALRNGYDPAR